MAKSIEEKAYAIYPNLDFCNNETKRAFAEARQKLISFATEQDRIARREERERCIKAAQKWYCEFKCLRKGSKDCETLCGIHSSIIDAMEGGKS